MSREIINRSKKLLIRFMFHNLCKLRNKDLLNLLFHVKHNFYLSLKAKQQYKKANPFSKTKKRIPSVKLKGIRFLVFTPQYSLTHYITPLVTTLSSFFLHTIVQAFQHQLLVPSYTQAYIYLLQHALTRFQSPQYS